MRAAAAVVAAGAALVAGCAGPSLSAKLPPKDRAVLEATAREPRDMGVDLVSNGRARELRSAWRVVSRRSGEIPFQASRRAGEPLVIATVNGQEVLAIVDTGASATIVEAAAAVRLGIVPLREPRIQSKPGTGTMLLMQGQALGARFGQFLGVANEVEAGGLRVAAVPIGILDLAAGIGHANGHPGRRAEMLLGADVLRLAGRVTFDFPGNRVLFGDPQAALRGRRIVTTVPLVEASPVPLIEVEVQGLGNTAMAIDTGGDFDLWLPLCVGGNLPIERLGQSLVHVGTSIGGQTLSVPTVRRQVYVGGRNLGPIYMEVDLLGRFASPVPYGLLGRRALKRFVVSIDYEQGWITFAQ